MINKILIFDDDPPTLDVIQLVFTNEGYDVLGVSDCNDVYATIEYFNPNIILMDVLMGRTDGRDICKELKSSSYHQVPIF